MAEQSDNIYIADLPAEVDDNIIHQILGTYGAILSCKAMQGKFPGQKGAALVRFASTDEAAWVVQNLNGNIPEGLLEPVKVRFANQKGGGGGGGGGNGGAGGYGKMSVPGLGGGAQAAGPYSGGGGGGGRSLAGTEQPSDNVYVADLPEDVNEQMVKSIFAGYGTVMACKAMQSKRPGQKGAALVRFGSVEEASWVVQNLNGNIAEGLDYPVQVRFSNNGKGGGKGGGGGGFDAGAGAGGGFAQGGGFDASLAGLMGAPAGQASGGKGGGGKGKGKPGTFSSSDMAQVISGLVKQLPGSGKKPDENCLYITGLPINTTDLDLYKLFAPFGAIPATGVKAKVSPDGTCSGVGFVDFSEAECAYAAQEALNGLVLPDGTPLKVASKRPKGQPQGFQQ